MRRITSSASPVETFNHALPREVAGDIDLASLRLQAGAEHPLFITARQRDQSRVWTSAIFITTPR